MVPLALRCGATRESGTAPVGGRLRRGRSFGPPCAVAPWSRRVSARLDRAATGPSGLGCARRAHASGLRSGVRPSTISTARRANPGPSRPAAAALAAAALPAAARGNALENHCKPEQCKCEVEWHRAVFAPRHGVVALEIGGLVRDAQGREVESKQAPYSKAGSARPWRCRPRRRADARASTVPSPEPPPPAARWGET